MYLEKRFKNIKSQPTRDLFFRMYDILKIKINIISNYLNISKSTLYKWVKEGRQKPINPTRIKGKTKLKCAHKNIETLIQNNNTITLVEIKNYIKCNFQIIVSKSTISRFCIKELKLSYKKGVKQYSESNIDDSKQFINKIKNVANIAAIDESSFVLNHVPKYARSKIGTRAIIQQPGQRGKRYSLILCISNNGVIKWELHEKSIDSIKFKNFIEQLPSNLNIIIDH